MKNLYILGFHGKIRFLGGGHKKKQYIGEGGLSKKGGVGQFADLRRGAWQEREGGG